MPATVLRSADRVYRVTVEAGERVSIDNLGTVMARVDRSGVVVVNGERAWVAAAGDTRWVFLQGHTYEFDVQRPGYRRRAGLHHDSLSAPMPATVARVQVSAGAEVRRGETLLVLEAMKMELPVRAPADGIVTAVHCREGELVQPGTILIELDD